MTALRKGLLILGWILAAGLLSFLARTGLEGLGVTHRGLISFATQAPFSFMVSAPLVWRWWRSWRSLTTGT